MFSRTVYWYCNSKGTYLIAFQVSTLFTYEAAHSIVSCGQGQRTPEHPKHWFKPHPPHQSILSHIQMLAHCNVHSFHTGFIKDSQISELTFVSSLYLCWSHTTVKWLSLPLSPLSKWLKSPTCLKPLVVKQLSNLSSGYPELKEKYLVLCTHSALVVLLGITVLMWVAGNALR